MRTVIDDDAEDADDYKHIFCYCSKFTLKRLQKRYCGPFLLLLFAHVCFFLLYYTESYVHTPMDASPPQVAALTVHFFNVNQLDTVILLIVGPSLRLP